MSQFDPEEDFGLTLYYHYILLVPNDDHELNLEVRSFETIPWSKSKELFLSGNTPTISKVT